MAKRKYKYTQPKTKEDIIKEIKAEIAGKIEELDEMDHVLDRKRDVEIALIKANSFFTHKFFSMRIINAIIADLNAIKRDLLPEEERDIFNWERIHELTMALDAQVDAFEKRRGAARTMAAISEARKELKELKALKRLVIGEESELRQLAKKHNEIAAKVDEIIAMIKDAEPKVSGITGKISKAVSDLKKLLDEDEDICNKLKKNFYVQMKLRGYFLNTLEKEHIFMRRPTYEIRPW